MAKIVLNDVTNLSGNPSSGEANINSNSSLIEAAIENTLSRDGTSPNTMSANLDMNSNKVENVGAPSLNSDAVRLVDLSDSDATGAASAQLRLDLASTATDDGTKGRNLVHVEPIAGETGIENHAFERDQLLRFIPVSLHDGIRAKTDSTDLSAYIQNCIDSLEATNFGSMYADGGKYNFTGITVGKTISLEGVSGGGTNFVNNGAGKMFDYQYVGVGDVDKRNFIYVNDIRFTDSVAGTGTGFYSNLFFFIEFNRCFFEGFTAGYGINAEETLWFVSNNTNTDGSNLRVKSVLNPHFNNIVMFNGGELRNHETYAIECELGDIVQLIGVTIEGDSGNTTSPTRACHFKDVSMIRIDGMYSEFTRTSDSVLYFEDCRAVRIARSNLASNSTTVPSIHLKNTSDVEITECVLNWFPLKTEGTTYNVRVRHTSLWGQIDIEEGNGVTFEHCSPNNTATCIPVDPEFQPEIFSGEGVPMKNWYTSSDFQFRDPTSDVNVSSTATTSWETADGYHDLFSLKAVCTGAQTVVFNNMGTTDNLNDGAIISFMAKASINTEVTCQGSISVTLGTARAQFTTEWKRYFVFTKLSTAAAGTGISCIFTSTETCDFYIDDIQTVAYQSFKEAGHLFGNFHYVPTHGTKITVAEQRNLETHKKHFDRGINLRELTVAPNAPGKGDVFVADGATWDPLSTGGAAGGYMVRYTGSAYRGLHETDDGTNLG